MRLKKHGQTLRSTLKAAVATRPIVSSQSYASPLSQCQYASVSCARPNNIAVFGGGIAGLASAYFISREFPKCKITIFEAGKEIGGWIKSKQVEVPGGNIVFELGPRTLRISTPTLFLVQELGLTKDILTTSKKDPGAKNRYIYYPDRLNQMPSGAPSLADIFSLWRSGILAGATGAIKEPLVPKRPDSLSDETVGSFLARRFDKRMANNIVSAVFHGIYAGDIWQLSAKTLLGTLWHLEGKYGSSLGGYLRMNSIGEGEIVSLVSPDTIRINALVNHEIYLNPDISERLKGASLFTFKRGMQRLVQALQGALIRKGNVEIRTETPVQSYKLLQDAVDNSMQNTGIQVVSGNSPNQTTETFDLAISTLCQPSLTPFVTVMTVNLYYANPDLLRFQGFGYLIPQSVPFEQNPERALGVIFDSSAIKGQDTVLGTKLTVMMGGHWWDGWSSYPSEREGLEMAKALVQRHLHISDTPTAHCVNLSKDCIPQYTINYSDRLRDFAEHLYEEYKGRLRVVGSQVSGVGVNDCITGAWMIARSLRSKGWKRNNCGLEHAVDEEEWEVVPSSELGYHKKQKKRGSED